MFHTVRAAGFAAAAFVAAATLWDGPLSAWQGDGIPTPATSWLTHAAAPAEVGDLGLNETLPEAAPEPDPVPVAPPPPPLSTLVERKATGETANAEQHCLASAVYFEARGESLEGQLAVAEVVLNRTRSGRYPDGICAVVRQRAQFSFVRGGVIPRADRNSPAWRRAVAVARIAEIGEPRLLSEGVLWYHAHYVSPSWGRRLARTTRIGAHIFYS
ncbi:MAG: cell wall hydrolase [Sphingomonas sp.]|nr:cell wall hydrolase [Sphingomonas sp.]